MKFFSQFNQKLNQIVLMLTLMLIFGLLAPAPANAAIIPLILDGTDLTHLPEGSTAAPVYALEQSDSAFVPLRAVSELLGARVSYAKGLIQIGSGDTELRLQIGSPQIYKSTAEYTDKVLTLSAAPFEKNSTTYVPLRFIAESLDCTVWYHEGQVSIATEPLVIDGQAVDRMEYLAHATMGANVYRLQSNQLMRSIYQQLQACQSAPAASPTYVTSPSVALNGDFCRHINFDFYNAANEQLCSITIYKQYQQPGEPAPNEPLRSYPFVIGDNLTNTFYSCTQEDYAKLVPLIDYCEAYGKLIHTAP